MSTEAKLKDIEVVTTPAFKLKDKAGRRYQAINLQSQFGFIPETIIIEKVPGHTNTLIVRAIVPLPVEKKNGSKTKKANNVS